MWRLMGRDKFKVWTWSLDTLSAQLKHRQRETTEGFCERKKSRWLILKDRAWEVKQSSYLLEEKCCSLTFRDLAFLSFPYFFFFVSSFTYLLSRFYFHTTVSKPKATFVQTLMSGLRQSSWFYDSKRFITFMTSNSVLHASSCDKFESNLKVGGKKRKRNHGCRV